MPIFGTRPEGIKMAPLVTALQKDPDITCVFVNTAQHREMLDQVLALYDLTPQYDLDIMKDGQTPLEVTSRILTELNDILSIEKPDIVLVHGDTTTTFAAAYAASLHQIPVGHVEAGLRTYNLHSPFPEEMNRQLVGRIASLHFAPTEANKHNLCNERISEKQVHVVGNTVIDALLTVSNRPYAFTGILQSLMKNGKKTILMTTHRRENLDQMQGIYQAVNRLIEKHPDVQVLFPVHKNPKVRKEAAQGLMQSDRIHVIEPLDYETFAQVMKQSFLILTDSGGIQEEAPSLGKPVLVARHTTERQEGVEAGTLKLVGTDENTIFTEAHRLITDEAYYAQMANAQNPYGDGRTSHEIVTIIKTFLSKTT